MRRLPVRGTLLLALLLSAACESGPAPGPGTLTASLVSPHGAEGAAVLRLHGPGIEGVSSRDGWLFAEPAGGDTVAVAVVADAAGALTFRVAVADTLRPPAATVLQVADPDDVLRADLSGYRVELVP